VEDHLHAVALNGIGDSSMPISSQFEELHLTVES
jgi:hypothetical protein